MVVAVIPARAEYPGEATSLAPDVVLFYRFNLPCPCSGISSTSQVVYKPRPLLIRVMLRMLRNEEAGAAHRRCQKCLRLWEMIDPPA